LKVKKIFPILVLFLLTGCTAYKVENGKWCWISHDEAVGRRVTVINGADQKSFAPINRIYARDDKNVYFENVIIPGADPGTFIYLGQFYSKDGRKVFWRQWEIKGADPLSFQIVDGSNLWSKDNKDFYFGRSPLGVLDVTSFRIINGGWGKDSKAYYAAPQFAKVGRVNCDYATMKILSDTYAIDKNHAYYCGIPIDGADVKTFRVTGYVTAKDKYRTYNGEYVSWFK